MECLPKRDKRNVLASVQTYWLLKRHSRNGLPLLRRLQVAVPPAVATKVWLLQCCINAYLLCSTTLYFYACLICGVVYIFSSGTCLLCEFSSARVAVDRRPCGQT